EKIVLLRRSNPIGQEIVDETKTSPDQEIPLPDEVLRVLRAHVDALPPGPMRDSDRLFPAVNGKMRARSVLDKPLQRVLKALGWKLRLTPRGCAARSTTWRGRPTLATSLRVQFRAMPPSGCNATIRRRNGVRCATRSVASFRLRFPERPDRRFRRHLI